MGEPKQLMKWGGRSLVRRASEVALQSRCDALYVVAGDRIDAIRSELSDLDAVIEFAADWQHGISRSIRCGVDAVSRSTHPVFGAVLLLLADQPRITPEHLDRLIDSARNSDASLAATHYAGTLGVPAVFGRRHFPALCALEGDRGAQSLLLAEPTTQRIPFPDAAFDIDTPDDLPSD